MIPFIRFSLAVLATAFAASIATGETVSMSWKDNSPNEVGFSIERSTDGGAFEEIATVPENENTFTDEGLEIGQTLVYRVRAYNHDGYSAYSNEAQTVVKDGKYWRPFTPEETPGDAETMQVGSLTINANHVTVNQR